MTQVIWTISALLFSLGMAAVVLRRQLLAMLLGLELMISAVNIALVYYANLFGDAAGLSAALLIIAVAAAEAVVGLALILKVYQSGQSADVAAVSELQG